MLYVVGEESDEKQHAKYHADFDEGVKWTVRLERPRKYFEDGSRIVAIGAQEPKPTQDLINKILKMSDGEMSAGDDVSKLVNRDKTLFLVHINSTNHITGYVCAEQIEQAFELIDYESSKFNSEQPVKAECGVLYLWVHPHYRKKGIATWLVDIVRANIKSETVVNRSHVAVCDPTESAVPFFTRYLRNKRAVRIYQQT